MGDEEDFALLPLSERVVHKSWKARVSGFEALAKWFSTTPSSDANEWRDNADFLKKGAADANAAAQEAALTALLAFAAGAPGAVVKQTRSTLVPIVVEKGLAQSRQSSRQRSIEIVLMYIEAENKADGVVDDTLPFLSHKTPKNVSACVSVLKDMLQAFGAKIVPVKPILKHLAKLFDHKDGGVRNESTQLTIEIYKWLGPALLPSLTDLKPVQLKDLNDQFEQLDSSIRPTPLRLVRSEMAKREAVGYVAEESAGTPADVTESVPEPIDVFDISDPVNVLDNLPKGFYDALNAKKWSDRKEILEALLVVVKKSPKLEDGRYGELVGVLAKKINDPHVIVLSLAINTLEFLARGLRTNFSQYRGLVLSPLLEKLKEKKSTVLESIRTCLDALFLCLNSLTDVMEDLSTALAHKNPQIKAETTHWLLRCLQNLRKVPTKADTKVLAETMVKLVDDADSGVRDAAMEGLGNLMKVVGERGVIGFLDKVEKGKMDRIREFCEQAVVKVGGGGVKKAVAAAPVAVVRDVPASAPVVVKPRPGTVRSGPPKPKPAAKKTPASAPSASSSSASASAGGSKKKSTPKEDEPLTFKFSDDSAELWMSEHFADVNLKDFADSNWKTRLSACHAFAETLKTAPAVEPEAIIRFFSKSPGWKESNFQVMTSVIHIFEHLAKENKASKGALSIVISAIAEKLGDAKLKKVTGDCFTTFSEHHSLQYVLTHLYDPLSKAKSPKTLADAFLWIHASVLEFGIKGLDIRALVEFAKTAGLGNTNAGVRGNAVIVLGGLRMFVGPDIRTFVADLSGPQLATVDAEFEKVAVRAPPEPTRVVNDEGGAGESGGGGEGEDPMDSLFPRVDLMTKVSAEVFDKMGDTNWKVRKEGLDELAGVLEAVKRVKPNLGEVPTALKSRLGDSNRNLGTQAAELCGTLAVATGKPFTRVSGLLLGPIAALLADQKPHVRACAINAFENVYTACGIDCFISPSATALLLDSPNLRKELLKFLGDKLGLTTTLPKMEDLLKPLMMCLQDKNSDVRKCAVVVLAFVAQDVGVQTIQDRAGDWFSGSALASLKPFFVPLMDVVGASGAVKSSRAVSPKPVAASKRATVSAETGKAKPSTGLKKRPVAGSAPPASKPSPEPISSGTSTPVLTSDPRAKESRANHDRGMTKWTFESPRKDLVDFLHDQCNNNISDPVIALLFSTDHYKEKDFLQGLTLLDDSVQLALSTGDAELKAKFVANTDLILKYLTIRFFDTNTSMLIKVLELLEHLFGLLDEEGVTLSEYEASTFLPFFIVKVGDNKETMRLKIRAIFKQLCKIYPPSKLFTYLLSALTSKNSRVRTECLEELGDLIKKNGMSVCVSSKVLPVIALQIADSDAKVRNAALGTVCQAYLLMGDAVYKQLGRISEKDKSLLEEKVKRLPPPPRVAKQATVAAAPKAPASPMFKRRQATPTEESVRSAPVASGLVGIPKLSSASTGGVKKEFSLDLDKMNLTRARSTTPNVQQQQEPEAGETLMLDYLVSQITSSDAYQSIDALKQLEKAILQTPTLVTPHINEIISAVTLQIRIAFSAADLSQTGTTRLCKHLVNVLVQVFSNASIAREIQRVALHQCVQELLNRLLDPGLQGVDQGPQLAKALNVLMVRVLDNTDRNLSFAVLLTLLEQSATASAHCSPEDLPLQAKYTELVMKCLWKLTKVIPQLIQEHQLDASHLILAVHQFLTVSPPNEWKRRAAEKVIPQADMPLRTVKTILHELCNCLGEKVLQCTVLVEDPSRSHAVGYIRQMLGQPAMTASSGASTRTASAAAPLKRDTESPTTEYDQKLQALKRSMAPPTTERSRTPVVDTYTAPSAPTTIRRPSHQGPLAEVEADAQLTVIFARISAKEETKQGIADLHRFRKEHPDCEVYVNQHLGKTGNYFQGYIKRGLLALEEEEKNSGGVGVGVVRPSVGSGFGEGMVGSSYSNNDAYRETLARFQQQLHKPETETSSEPNIAPKQRFSMPVPRESSSAAMFSSMDETRSAMPMASNRFSVPPPDRLTDRVQENMTPVMTPVTRTQTVEQLKARLAAMKVA
ncbi:Cytoskeleton associated protein 5 [Podochytrium sp. JEL0797]|nr:Cytoskeleton associated protein 5 [Podochytrium sp. JEL0797]